MFTMASTVENTANLIKQFNVTNIETNMEYSKARMLYSMMAYKIKRQNDILFT